MLASASILTLVRGDLAIIIWLLASRRLIRMSFYKELYTYLKEELIPALDGSIARVFSLVEKV